MQVIVREIPSPTRPSEETLINPRASRPRRTPPVNPAIDTTRGWSERVQRLFLDVRALARDHVELAVLETQRAGQVLVQTMAAAVAVSVLLATAWLGIVAALVVWMTNAGVSWPVALLIGAAACLLVAAAIVFWVKRHIPDLMFSATLRQLRATKEVPEHVEVNVDTGMGADHPAPPAGAGPKTTRQATEGVSP